MSVPNQTATTKLTRLKNKKKQLEDKKAKASPVKKLPIERQLRNLRSDIKEAQASLKKTLTKSGAKSDVGEGAKNTRKLQSSNNKDIDKSASGKGIIKKGKPAGVSPTQKSRQSNLSVVQKNTQKTDVGDTFKKNQEIMKKAKSSPAMSSIGKDAEAKPPKPRPKPKVPRKRNKDVEGIATTEKKIASKKAAQGLATQEKRSAKKPTTKDVGGADKELSKDKFVKQMKNPKKKSTISKKAESKPDDYSGGKRVLKSGLVIDSSESAFRTDEDDLNLRKGGMPRGKSFGKGGMYKGGKKTYGMKYGGITRRGMGK
tara:strand:- start:18 stop:959 length:942 start_codon:yes stop_codon:yes gene_type:complete